MTCWIAFSAIGHIGCQDRKNSHLHRVARQSDEAQADREEEGDLKVFSLITPFLDHTYNTAQNPHLGHILTSFLASM